MDFGYPTEAIIILTVAVVVSVWLDLFSHRDHEEISIKNAAAWSAFWVCLALAFAGYLAVRFSTDAASLFLSGYVLEKALSVDNLMVFVAIFASFGIKGMAQHRVLYYGIAGALVFRAFFIVVGTSLFGLSSWIELAFAAIVLWTGVMMFRGSGDDDDVDYSQHWSVRWTQSIMPVLPHLVGKKFVIKGERGREIARDNHISVKPNAAFYVTPMLLCLLCIEVSDVIFAFDSVPAIIAITQEPFLVYASVIFAILGLRSLYFVLAAAAESLVHLEKAVAVVLVFIAIKLAGAALGLFHIHHLVSLAVVLGLIALGVIASLVFPEKEGDEASHNA